MSGKLQDEEDRAFAERVRDLLREHQFARTDADGVSCNCLESWNCPGSNDPPIPHHADCRVAALLREAEERAKL